MTDGHKPINNVNSLFSSQLAFYFILFCTMLLTPYSTCCEQDWYVKLNDQHGTALTHSLRFKSPTHSVRSLFLSELVQSIGAFTAHHPRLFSQSRICYRIVYYIRRTYDSMGEHFVHTRQATSTQSNSFLINSLEGTDDNSYLPFSTPIWR